MDVQISKGSLENYLAEIEKDLHGMRVMGIREDERGGFYRDRREKKCYVVGSTSILDYSKSLQHEIDDFYLKYNEAPIAPNTIDFSYDEEIFLESKNLEGMYDFLSSNAGKEISINGKKVFNSAKKGAYPAFVLPPFFHPLYRDSKGAYFVGSKRGISKHKSGLLKLVGGLKADLSKFSAGTQLTCYRHLTLFAKKEVLMAHLLEDTLSAKTSEVSNQDGFEEFSYEPTILPIKATYYPTPSP